MSEVWRIQFLLDKASICRGHLSVSHVSRTFQLSTTSNISNLGWISLSGFTARGSPSNRKPWKPWSRWSWPCATTEPGGASAPSDAKSTNIGNGCSWSSPTPATMVKQCQTYIYIYMIYIHHICHFDPLPVDFYKWTPLKCCGGEAQTSLALRVGRKLRKGELLRIIQWDIEGIIPRIFKFSDFDFHPKNHPIEGIIPRIIPSIEQWSSVINSLYRFWWVTSTRSISGWMLVAIEL